jgi:3-keto-L-gulonate-6-phosphate decarboxylase
MGAESFPDRAAAEWALQNWAAAHRKRDDLIRVAVAAGVDTRRIQQLTGVAKTTIARIAQRTTS